MPRRARDHDEQQLDLFDQPAYVPTEAPVEISASVAQRDLTDAELLEQFPHASIGDVRSFGEEIRRRRPSGWEAAALALWNRFRGFGQTRPMPEQLIVLHLAESAADRGFVRDLLASGPVNECLEPELLLAAAVCRLALPAPIVGRGLLHGAADVRRAAIQLAMVSNVGAEVLLPYLSDPARIVRREAATALAEAGETTATESLLLEMRIQPSRAGLDALSYVADEDVVIILGQIARQHSDWCQIIIEVLETIDHPMAERVASGLIA